MKPRRLVIILCLLFVLITLSSYLIFSSTNTPPLALSPLHLGQPAPTPTPTPDPLRPVNVLLLGYAGPNHDGGNLTDTLILAHIDPKTPTVTLISIPRDLWVPLPLTSATPSGSKINAAWAIGNDDRKYPQKPAAYSGSSGGFNLAKYAVSQITGLNPDYAIAINFHGFETVISQLGGLNVTVPYSFTDDYYPLTGKETDPCGKTPEDIAALTATMSGEKLEREFPCRYEQLQFMAGPQSMDAETALKFVRSRHASQGGGDFNRARRQQALLSALKNEVFSLSNLPKLPSLGNTLLNSVTTDIDLEMVSKLIGLYPKPSEFALESIALTTQNLLSESTSGNGQYILIPQAGENNFSAIHTYLKDQILSSATPSPQP